MIPGHLMSYLNHANYSIKDVRLTGGLRKQKSVVVVFYWNFIVKPGHTEEAEIFIFSTFGNISPRKSILMSKTSANKNSTLHRH